MTSNIASEGRVILAIEAAVRGGSIVLLNDDHEIAAWHGTEDVSRAEDLLPNISDILDRTHIEKHEVDLIAVSNGPGSYTGIRIGLATALGLARALNIDCVGRALLPAIAELHRRENSCVVVIPIGRSELCWEAFDASDVPNSLGPPQSGSTDDFLDFSRQFAECDILMQHDAHEAIARTPPFEDFSSRAYNCGSDLALAVGLGLRNKVSDLTPNYIRNSQFKSGPV